MSRDPYEGGFPKLIGSWDSQRLVKNSNRTFDWMSFKDQSYYRSLPRPDWDDYFMILAKLASARSTCSSRPVGCVIVDPNRIVLGTGYNGPASGEPHCSDKSEPSKPYCYRREVGISYEEKRAHCPAVHAERNALRIADQNGISVVGATVYTTLSPCPVCTELLHSKGIVEVIYELGYINIPGANTTPPEYPFKTRQHSVSVASIERVKGYIDSITSERLLK